MPFVVIVVEVKEVGNEIGEAATEDQLAPAKEEGKGKAPEELGILLAKEHDSENSIERRNQQQHKKCHPMQKNTNKYC